MNFVNGNLIDLAEAGEFDIVVHGCNCFHTMGSGLALEIKNRWPMAYKADRETPVGLFMKLGNYSKALVGPAMVTCINAYTQYGYNKGASNLDMFEYDAFKLILRKLDFHLYTNDIGHQRFGFPLIGCGRAGGNKERILEILSDWSDGIARSSNATVTIVEFNKL